MHYELQQRDRCCRFFSSVIVRLPKPSPADLHTIFFRAPMRRSTQFTKEPNHAEENAGIF
jgi:hypothetical protein